QHVLERPDHRGVRQGHLARGAVPGGMRKPIMAAERYLSRPWPRSSMSLPRSFLFLNSRKAELGHHAWAQQFVRRTARSSSKLSGFCRMATARMSRSWLRGAAERTTTGIAAIAGLLVW